METLRIEIINPKAKKLLEDLANMDLIVIGKSFDPKIEFKALLSKLRSNSDIAPSPEEIAREVENVRAARYVNKAE